MIDANKSSKLHRALVSAVLAGSLAVTGGAVSANAWAASPKDRVTVASVAAATASPEAAAAYYRVVNDVVETYGIYTYDFGLGWGLAFAELVDFDNDGVPELYMIYFKDEGSTYTEEVWRYRDGQASRAFQESYSASGRVSDRATTLQHTSAKSYISRISHYSTGLGKAPYDNASYDTNYFLTLANNEIVEVARADYVWEENPNNGDTRETYTIKENGVEKQVSPEEYKQFLAKFEAGDKREVITSSAGQFDFAFDPASNVRTITDFMQSLRNGSGNSQGQAEGPLLVVDFQYEDSRSFSGGLAAVKKNGQWGFIDRTGKEAVPFQYDYVESFTEEFAAVERDRKWGFIDRTGREVVPPRYESVTDFSEGMASVRLDGRWGFIDRTGREVVAPQYDSVYAFHDGLAVIRTDDGVGFIDKSGRIVVSPRYLDAMPFSEGMAAVYNDGWGFVDTTGREVVAPQYGNPFSNSVDGTLFSEGLAVVYQNRKAGFIDKTGKLVIPIQFDYAEDFHEGLAAFRKDKKWGFIDQTGKEVIAPQYDRIRAFQEGFATVDKDGKAGFIDKTGQEVVKPQYKYAYEGFHEGLAWVSNGDKDGFIDKSGNEIIPLQYHEAKNFSEGLAAVNMHGRWGFIASPLAAPATATDSPAEWAKPEVDAAVSLQLVPAEMHNGYGNNITRADFSKLVVHLLTVKTGKSTDVLLADNGKRIDTAVFADTKDRSVLIANALGIVNGKGDGVFDPNGSITRQEAAVMLTRTATALGVDVRRTGATFADANDIAAWAKEAVAFVSSSEDRTNQAKIMGGTGDDRFSPLDGYTRQQAYITMKRLFNAI